MTIIGESNIICPDEIIDVVSDIGRLVRFYAVKNEFSSDDRNALATNAIYSIIIGALWDDLDHEKVRASEYAGSLMVSSGILVKAILDKFGRENLNG